ncbi:MAG: hypothetical protein H0U40_02930, partial [Chloroflexia bacterium]|nr:hypothetical protein [Chloroflexia bacterium]
QRRSPDSHVPDYNAFVRIEPGHGDDVRASGEPPVMAGVNAGDPVEVR